MYDKKLLDYISDALGKGYNIREIRKSLLDVGHPKDIVDSTIDFFYKSKLGTQKPKASFDPKNNKLSRDSSKLSIKLKFVSYKMKKIFLPLRIFWKNPSNRIFMLVLVTLFVLMVFLIVLNRPTPPIVYFVDAETGEPLQGKLYLDNSYLGDVKGIYENLPQTYCKGNHKLSLHASGLILTWNTTPQDCELYKLTLTHNFTKFSAKEPPGFITLEFIINATGQRMSGELYFDGKFIATINGRYAITRDECLNIHTINLTGIAEIDEYFFEWKHDPEQCNTELIRYVFY